VVLDHLPDLRRGFEAAEITVDDYDEAKAALLGHRCRHRVDDAGMHKQRPDGPVWWSSSRPASGRDGLQCGRNERPWFLLDERVATASTACTLEREPTCRPMHLSAEARAEAHVRAQA